MLAALLNLGFAGSGAQAPVSRTQDQRFQFSALYLENYPPIEIYQQFLEVENQFRFGTLEKLNLAETHVAPDKPQNGDIRYCDGTNWDGRGDGTEGLCAYVSGSWVALH